MACIRRGQLGTPIAMSWRARRLATPLLAVFATLGATAALADPTVMGEPAAATPALATTGLATPALGTPGKAMPGMPMTGADDPEGNLELFLTLRAAHTSGEGGGTSADEDAWALGDLVFSASHGRLRLMGEYNLSTAEHDFERLQVGFEPLPDTLLWLGRFHQPGSAWNNEFHHGPYMQTTISRPSIEFWEDEEGVLPQHLAGLLGESRIPIGPVAGFRAALGVGYGSSLKDEGLDPISVIERTGGGHHASVTAQLAYLPTYVGQSGAGLLFARHLSGVVEPALRSRLQADQVGLGVVGAYVDWLGEHDRLLAVVYHVDVQLESLQSGVAEESFLSGYVQLEHGLPHSLTLYYRHENSHSGASSRYINAFAEDLILHGNTLGMRLDLPHRQALTLEGARFAEVEGNVSRIRLQWSAALP